MQNKCDRRSSGSRLFSAKGLYLAVLFSCLAILALLYFSETGEVRKQAGRSDGESHSYGRSTATGTSTAAHQTDNQSPEPRGGVWQGFLSWIGLYDRPEKGTLSSPQPIQQVNLGGTQRSRISGGGSGAISGRVLNEAGQAVLGMEISAESLKLFQAPQGFLGNGPVAQVMSDQKGTYRFEQLPEGEYRIRTIATDLYVPAEIVVRTGVDSADLVVSGDRQLFIQGTVKDIKGELLEGVRVVSAQTPPREVVTDQNGNYGLQVRLTRSDTNYVLKFQRADYREAVRQLNDSQIRSQSTVQLNVSLTPIKSVAIVAGKVRDRKGAPLPGEIVHLQGLGSYQAVTNQAGEFVMNDVETGQSYKLQVPALSPYRPYVKPVQVGPEGLWQDIVVELGPPESSPLSGRMMDPAGNSLPGFSIWLQSFNPEAPAPIPVTSDDTGRYAIDEVPLGGLSFTTRSQPRLLIRGIDLPAGGAANVDLILDWGRYEVIGQVVDGDGRPMPGSSVVLFWSYIRGGVQSLSERKATADANGFFRFAQVGPGVHSVRVSVPGFRSAQLQYDVGVDSEAVVLKLLGAGQTALAR